MLKDNMICMNKKYWLPLIIAAIGQFMPLAAAETTAIFDPMFRSLTVTKNDDLMTIPVIALDMSDNLVFSFDEISDDRRYLRCKLFYCDADWEPSRLVESEYADGFNFDEIEDFGFSQNSYVHYVNYRYVLNKDSRLQPLVSGNYVWQVYDESDPDRILLQVRFRVSEESSVIVGRADGRTDKGFNDEWQQLSLRVNQLKKENFNPYTDLILEIEQNTRPDTSRKLYHPQRVEGSEIIYEHLPELIFPAGNEYRRFETVRADYPGMNIDSVRFYDGLYHAYVTEGSSRAGRGYLYDRTQRGRYKVDEYNATDPDLGADYVMTHFALDFPEIMDGDIFLEGDLFLRGYTDVNKMRYDRQSGLYLLDVPLKQGSYNYQYVVKRRGSAPSEINIGGGEAKAVADSGLIEGNIYETINEYNIYLYLRQPGSRWDRLIGYATIEATP